MVGEVPRGALRPRFTVGGLKEETALSIRSLRSGMGVVHRDIKAVLVWDAATGAERRVLPIIPFYGFSLFPLVVNISSPVVEPCGCLTPTADVHIISLLQGLRLLTVAKSCPATYPSGASARRPLRRQPSGMLHAASRQMTAKVSQLPPHASCIFGQGPRAVPSATTRSCSRAPSSRRDPGSGVAVAGTGINYR